MSCDAKAVGVVYAEPKGGERCGCMVWGHYGADGKPCHHETVCVFHRLEVKIDQLLAAQRAGS